jgi:hypothetical protein
VTLDVRPPRVNDRRVDDEDRQLARGGLRFFSTSASVIIVIID